MNDNSGYHDCPCHDCFEVAIGETDGAPDFCWECEEAGCDGSGECQVEGRYEEACADAMLERMK